MNAAKEQMSKPKSKQSNGHLEMAYQLSIFAYNVRLIKVGDNK